MDLSGLKILAHLEEDNTQRMLFRVRPLLTSRGLITPEDLDAYKDHGYLRIAPDRKEQHTFKERMQQLGSLCLMDLSDKVQALRKVRPNRNYAPFRGEHNRYIVYSDAIQPLPPDLVYEVVAKEENRSHKPLTSRYYVRSGGFITGPYASAQEEAEGASQSLPPDCDRLFLVTMPDNQHRLFYWPDAESAEGSEACAPKPLKEAPPQQHAQPENAGSVRSLADLFFRRRQPPAAALNDLKAAAEALENALGQAGFDCDGSLASHLLLTILTCRPVQLASPLIADAATAGEVLAALFGQKSLLSPTGDIPAQSEHRCMLLSPRAVPAAPAHCHLVLAQSHAITPQNAAAYALAPWPVVSLKSRGDWPGEEPLFSPLNPEQLRQQLCQKQNAISRETETQLQSWQRQLTNFEVPMPLSLKRSLTCYLSHASALIPDENIALGYAAAAFLLPYALFKGVPDAALRQLFSGHPEALKLI